MLYNLSFVCELCEGRDYVIKKMNNMNSCKQRSVDLFYWQCHSKNQDKSAFTIRNWDSIFETISKFKSCYKWNNYPAFNIMY